MWFPAVWIDFLFPDAAILAGEVLPGQQGLGNTTDSIPHWKF